MMQFESMRQTHMNLLPYIFAAALLGAQEMEPAFIELRRVLEKGSEVEKLDCLERIQRDNRLWQQVNAETVSLKQLLLNLATKDNGLKLYVMGFINQLNW